MIERYFEDPQYLWLLLLIPVLVAIYVLMHMRQKHRLRRFGDPELVRQLMPDVSRWRPFVKFGMLLVAFALLVVVFARPHIGVGTKTEKRTGIETIIAIDVSNSMRAQDVSPSRLDRSKMMVENMVDKFSNDKIGLIVFAGDAFVQLPMTSDYVSAKMFLSSIDPSMIVTQGTDIAEAIDMASHSFSQEDNVGKAIIVITDGEDHEGGAVEAAEDARNRGMRVYVLGVGSTKGSPIPDPSTGRYMTDNAGNTVMSALNEDMCKQIAQAGGGAYIHVENGYAAQEQLNNELDKLAKKEVSVEVYNAYEERFIEFALLALVFIVLEVLLLERKSPLLRNVRLFRKKETVSAKMLLLLCVASFSFLAPQTATAQNDRHYIRQGNRLFRRGAFADAEVKYRKALEANKENPQAIYNLGNALLMQQKDSAAIEQYQLAAKFEKNPLRKYQSYHNIGVICQGRHMFKEAIEAYKEALRLNPNDDETRYNLEVCKRQLKNQQQGGGGNNDQNKDNQDKKDDQNKDKKDDQNKDKKDDQNKDKKDDQQNQDKKENQQNQQNQDQQEQKPRMSKENAEQLLNAAIQKEKQTQQRLQEQQQRMQNRRRLQKNW